MSGIRSYPQLLIEWFCASRRLWLFGALAAVLATIGPTVAWAGTNTWTSNGPYGGLVTVLAQDPKTPSNVYAAGFSGVYKSSNGGSTWALASSGISDPTIDAIAIDPVTPTTLYAGSVEGGAIVKSTDGAASWKRLSITLVNALAINPASTNIVYAAQSQSGLQKSTDGGTTWSKLQVSVAPTFPSFKTLAIDPKTPSTIYAGEQSSGIYKSTDGGTTWSTANSGFTGPIIQVLAFAIDPQSPATLYVAANTSGGSGLFKSTNGGNSWSTVLADKNDAIGVQSVAVDPTNSSNVYIGTFSAGIERSTNAGTSFAKIDSGLPQVGVSAIAINPQNSSNVLIGTLNGVFATSNSGAGWSTSSNGLALTTVTAVSVDPATSSTIYAVTTTSGIFKSTDSGGSWNAINNGIGSTDNSAVNSPSYTSIAIDPTTPTTLYVGSQSTEQSGVYKSTDGGRTWVVAASGLPEFQSITALGIDPLTTSTLYAGTGNDGVFQSTDAGATWVALPESSGSVVGIFTAIVPRSILPASSTIADTPATADNISIGAIVYSNTIVYYYNGKKIDFKSLPNDNSECEGGVDDGYFGAGLAVLELENPAQFFIACVSPDAVLIGPNTVLTDGYTITFVPASDPTANPQASIEKTPVHARTSTTGQTITPWAAPDGNSDETTACTPVASIVGDPLDPNGFYAGASCGVLHGTNSGQKIVTMNSGLPPNLQINSITSTHAGDTLYAGAAAGGVYQFSKTSTTASFNPDQVGLTGAWYNPATGGQGIVMQVLPDYLGAGQGLLFGGWFTYDVAPAGGAEKQRWYTLQGAVSSSSSSATIPIFASYGGNFNAPPALGAATQVGQAVMNFSDCTHATMNYSFTDGSGRSSSMPLQRLSSNVSCAPTGSTTTATPDYLLSGAWFDPSTGGQGFVYDVNPVENILFAAWYTYAPSGQTIGGPASQRWYTVQAPFTAGITSLSNVPIFAASGGIFDNPASVTTTQVGSGTLTFQSCNGATLTYTFTAGTNQGKSGTVNLSRTGFVPTGCSL